MRSSRGLGCLALALTLLGAPAASADPSFRTVARSGRPVPGFPASATYSEFRDAVLDERGNVAFVGTAIGEDVFDDLGAGLWLARPRGAVSLVVRDGAKLRGFRGMKIDVPGHPPILTPDGALVYRVGVRSKEDPGTSHGVLLRSPLGRRLRPLLWPDSPPHDATAIFYDMQGVRIGAGGMAFLAPEARGGSDLNALYVWNGRDSPKIVTRIGEEIEGAGHPVVRGIRWSEPGASGLPALLLETQRANYTLHWTLRIPDASGRYVERARSGEPPPAGPIGSVLATVDFPRQNRTGDVAFEGELTPPRTDAGITYDGLIEVLRADGSAEMVARIADPAPGAPPGAVFGRLDLIDLSDSGAILFRGVLRGDAVTDRDNKGFWLHDRSSGLRPVFRDGDILACLPDRDDLRAEAWPGMNADGIVVLRLGSSSGAALVAFLPNGECVALVKRDDLLLVGRSAKLVRDFATTSDGWFPAYAGRILNDAGELVFTARFDDGTEAVMVADRIAPAPTQ